MVQLGRNFGFVKLEKTVSVLFPRRMTQGIFVGHHDRTGAVLCITKNGLCEATVGQDRH